MQKLKSITLLTLLVPSVLLAHTSLASSHPRLEISLVPTWIYMEDSEGELTRAGHEDLAETVVNMHRALSILGVRSEEYNIIVAPTDQHQTLFCTQTLAGGASPPRCKHPHDGPHDFLRSDQIRNLVYTMTGIWRNRAIDRGRIEYFVLLSPHNFVWASTYYGVNTWWSWNGFEPEDLHWSTTSCQIWSNAWLFNIAHELGHCFGLYHGGATTSDPNYDGVDDSMDFMSQGAHFYVQTLRQSNKNRVRHHFRELTELGIQIQTVKRAPEENQHHTY